MTFVVAIDGPAGTGKSSVARFLAHKLNYIYVDTGAIYRALAFLAEAFQKDADDPVEMLKLIPQINIVVDKDSQKTRIAIDKKYLDAELRTENISRLSSIVSRHQRVREALLDVQRNLISKIENGAIFEGRDIGTVVFPYAPVKIFITANSETRAQRRYEELKSTTHHASYDDVLEAIKNRDERDESRKNAPMQKALDAHEIDSSSMTLDEVTHEASQIIQAARKTHNEGKKLW